MKEAAMVKEEESKKMNNFSLNLSNLQQKNSEAWKQTETEGELQSINGVVMKPSNEQT